MKLTLGVILYIAISLAVLQGWWWLLAVSVLVFSGYYSTIYLVGLAIFIDGYFGSFHTMPVWSFVAVSWFLLVELIRPRFIDFKNF